MDFTEPATVQNLPTPCTGIIPDAVLTITHPESQKTLLFFLEVDRATEALKSTKYLSKIVSQKILKYQNYLTTEGYKQYERHFASPLHGFRLLFVCNSAQRLSSLCGLVREDPQYDFIWLTTENSILAHGLGSLIWIRGGNDAIPRESILSLKFAFESPILPERVFKYGLNVL